VFRDTHIPPFILENKMAKQDNLDDDDSIWIVYESPPDFPDQYVARRMKLNRPTGDFVVGNTMNDVRSKLPKGLFKIERSDRDDPLIRESWI
jgi:hypothetical protein